jgi:NAD(P)-dependent dehydrogenase (short-subunit alcohol dehydrogenase family)
LVAGLEGKVAVVTGTTSGVGRGSATEFAKRRAKVVATGRREANGRALEQETNDTAIDKTVSGQWSMVG